jgi:hypothetical protein
LGSSGIQRAELRDHEARSPPGSAWRSSASCTSGSSRTSRTRSQDWLMMIHASAPSLGSGQDTPETGNRRARAAIGAPSEPAGRGVCCSSRLVQGFSSCRQPAQDRILFSEANLTSCVLRDSHSWQQITEFPSEACHFSAVADPASSRRSQRAIAHFSVGSRPRLAGRRRRRPFAGQRVLRTALRGRPPPATPPAAPHATSHGRWSASRSLTLGAMTAAWRFDGPAGPLETRI